MSAGTSLRERRDPGERILILGYLTFQITILAMYYAAYYNTWAQNPAMTRRFTPSMIVFGQIQQIMLSCWITIFAAPYFWTLARNRSEKIGLVLISFAHLMIWCCFL